MLTIGIIGPSYLAERNLTFFRHQQVNAYILEKGAPLQTLDGLLITGWKKGDYLRVLQQLYPKLEGLLEQLSVLGIASGATALGQNGCLKKMNCTITQMPSSFLSTSVLTMPNITTDRFVASFFPKIIFTNLAPNLGILCQDLSHGPIVIRQGNCLACSYIAEFTPHQHIYHYWLSMVAALKNSKEI